jgi:hypothetical protein
MPTRFRMRPLFLLALGMLMTLALVPSAQARPFQTGIHLVEPLYYSGPLDAQRGKQLGATYLKENIYWVNIAPGFNSDTKPEGFDATDPGDPGYKWAAVDNFVRNTRAQGLEPILNIVFAPKWARDSRCKEDSVCAPTPADFADFGTAIAKRYSGSFDPGDGQGVLPRARYFQAWTEPNLNFYFQPVFNGGRKLAPTVYRGILNAFYDAVHAVDNDNRVISAGLAPLQRPGATIGPLDFMRQLLCMKGRAKPKPSCGEFAKLDIWATHPYTTGGPTHKAPGADDVALGDLTKMTKLLRAAEKAGKIRKSAGPRRTPFWVTEFSYDSNPPDKGALGQALHTRWSTEAMYRMYQAGVDVMIWFGIRDQDPTGRPSCENFDSGLYFRGATVEKDRPKRFARAYRFPAVAFKTKRGFSFWGRTPDSKRGKVLIQLRNGKGGYRTVAKARAGAGGVFQGQTKVKKLAKNATVRVKAPRGGGLSVPFSLKNVRDFHQPPFGKCLGGGGGGGRPR